jgi:biotin-dependent carboxylase-like uncharacterized protein
MSDTTLLVTRVGWRVTFTDLGRQDVERLGVPAGGAADQHSAAVANLLVDNDRRSVLLECIGDFAFVPDSPVLVAVCGATATVTVDGWAVDQWTPLVVDAGQELSVSQTTSGLRTYIAVAGRLQAPRFLGSAAPDPRMGFRQVVAVGQQLQVTGTDPWLADAFWDSVFHFPIPRVNTSADVWVVDVVPAAEARLIDRIEELVAGSRYTVTPRSDHVGLRLQGPVRHPADRTEIVSHGVPIGAVEIPYGQDELIVLGRYRTLTAGYPIVGVVARSHQSLLGQAAPGQQIRFRWVDRDTAARQAQHVEDGLRILQRSVGDAFAAMREQARPPLARAEWMENA